MRYSLASLVKSTKPTRRKAIVARPIEPTEALASNLYASVYKPIITAWQGAVPRIVAAYERALPVRDSIHDSVFDIDSILASLGDELSRLVLSLTPALRSWAIQTERWHRGKWRGNILTATGVDLSTMLFASGEPQSVQDTIAWNTSLVKSVNDDTRAKIGSAVFAAYTARKPSRELAAELQDIVGSSRKRALGIASDQTSKLAGALDRERAKDAGIEQYIWMHSHKLHPRPVHVARNGKLFRYDTPPDDGPPGTQPFCGCRARAYIDLG